MNLNQEIRQIKRKSFPELRFVYVRGIYVPDEKILPNFGNVTSYILQIESENVNGSSRTPYGFALIKFPNCSSGNQNINVRKGIIAHELSHLFMGEIHLPDNEGFIDSLAINRGYIGEVLAMSEKMESIGFKRLGYSSMELKQHPEYKWLKAS